MRSVLPVFRASVFLVGAAVGAAQSGPSAVADLVVFGDSLSDAGNAYAITADLRGVDQRPPFPWYTLGRYTNGPDNTVEPRIRTATGRAEGLWVEQLADRLDILRPSHSLAGGRDYAYAGASSGPSSFGPGSLNVGAQISRYLETPLTDPSRGLFLVLAGANDIVNATVAPGATRQSILDAASGAVANLRAGIASLASALAPGQRITAVWANVPPFDRSPFGQQLPASLRAAMAEAIVGFRDRQLAAVADLRDRRGLTVVVLDLHALFAAVLDGTASWRPRDVAQNVIAAGNLGAEQLKTHRNNAVPNGIDPDEYVWWDELHFTARMHQLIAEAAMELLESPRGAAVTRVPASPRPRPIAIAGSPA